MNHCRRGGFWSFYSAVGGVDVMVALVDMMMTMSESKNPTTTTIADKPRFKVQGSRTSMK